MKALSRRSVLRGMGATVALPFLDAMVPSLRASAAAAAAKKTRLVCVEMVHGSAGSSLIGVKKNLWAPAGVGRDFDLTLTSLRSLEPFRDLLTIVSNTDVDPANPFTATEIGGDHVRSSAVFLTQAHPKQTQGGDVQAGVSLDQLYAQRFGQDTAIPSMQLCIENVDQAGGCGYGYSCVYTDAISWAAPDRPLPMIRDPRLVFDKLFSVLKVGTTQAERAERLAEDRSILDWVLASVARLQRTLGPADKARLSDYLEQVREIERRIQIVEARNRSGDLRELPAAPIGVPDSFSEHVKLMFDLQVLAFASDVTRVFAFKLGRDASNRSYPESGFKGTFHDTSHHSGREDKILNFAKLNTYHVGLMPYFLDKLKNTPDGDGTLLDSTLLIYGSPMGDSNLHNHKRVPFFMAGRANGALKGGVHLKAPNGTPLANVMLGVLQSLGLHDAERFGDSEGAFDLNGRMSSGPNTMLAMASMLEAIEIKRKTYFEYEGAPYHCLDVEVSKPTARGGQTLVRIKMRNMLTQAVFDRTFKAGDKFHEPDLAFIWATYLYADSSGYNFMDQRTFDTITLSPDVVGDDKFLLVDNLLIQIHTYNDKPLGLVFPPHVEITVASTEAGARGDTASGSVTKIAKLETGMEIRVPLFIKEGEKIKVHSESREFSGRA